jgi:hypothetical protein
MGKGKPPRARAAFDRYHHEREVAILREHPITHPLEILEKAVKEWGEMGPLERAVRPYRQAQ